MIKFFKNKIRKIFYYPIYTGIFCLIFLAVNLIFDGTLFQIFRLGRDLKIMKNRIHYIDQKNQALEKKRKSFLLPQAIEEKARDRLDFSNKDDLIFIFPEDI